MSKIQVIVKRPGVAPYVTNISNTLENLQRTVGGYIETVSFPEDGVVIVCDEEGRLKGKDYCCTVNGIDFVGDIFICGIDRDEFGDIPEKHKKQLLQILREADKCQKGS